MDFQLKFRGKQITWVYGGISFENDRAIIHEGYPTYVGYEVDKNSVGQYTNYNDVHGDEIYTGDLLTTKACDGVVIMKKGCFYLKGISSIGEVWESPLDDIFTYDKTYGEVIIYGNSFENKKEYQKFTNYGSREEQPENSN